MPSTAFLGAAIYFRTQVRRFFRCGFPGCGFSPYPGRSPGYGFSWVRQFISGPRCGDFSGTAFLGAAICRTQVGLSWVRLFLGAAIYFRTQVRLFSWVRRLAVPRSVFSRVRLFLGPAFPGYGYSWVSGDLRRRPQVRLFLRYGFSQVRLFFR